MSSHRNLVLLGLFVTLATACSPFAATPALRTVPLETAETVRPEHAALAVSGGAHGGEIFTGDVVSATGRARYGLIRDVELQLEGSWAYSPDLEEDRSVSGHVGAGRLGVKHRVLDWLAFTGGLGVGAGPWGTYGGGDLGVIFAYENPYVVPFYAIRMQLTAPFDARTETHRSTNGSGMPVVTLLTPTASLWFQNSTGVRVPICGDCEGARGSFTAAFAWSQLYALEQDRTLGALGGEIGFEIEL